MGVGAQFIFPTAAAAAAAAAALAGYALVVGVAVAGKPQGGGGGGRGGRRVRSLDDQQALPQDPVEFLASAHVQAMVEGGEGIHVCLQDGGGATDKMREGRRDGPAALCHDCDGEVKAMGEAEGEGGWEDGGV